MLLPILNGIMSLRLAPVTWALFFINLFVFVSTHQTSERAQRFMEHSLDDSYFAKTQGYLYSRHIERNSARYPSSLQEMSAKSLNSNDSRMHRLMGSLAMRDSNFLREALDLQFQGDQVAYEYWRSRFQDLRDKQAEHPSYQIGLTVDDLGWKKLITYQFAHGGISHFVGNMIFFLFFATVLEQVIGGLGLLCVYLLSGLAGALIYLFVSDASAIPLIGASGAVSGVMCLFVFLFWRVNVRYLFFLFLPKRGFFGFVFLPAWVILFVWGIHDLAGYLGTPSTYGGVAYSAHLGGELCGLLFGALFMIVRRLRGLPLLPPKLPVDTAPLFTKHV